MEVQISRKGKRNFKRGRVCPLQCETTIGHVAFFHPNYFGDLLLKTHLILAGRSLWMRFRRRSVRGTCTVRRQRAGRDPAEEIRLEVHGGHRRQWPRSADVGPCTS